MFQPKMTKLTPRVLLVKPFSHVTLFSLNSTPN